MAKQFTRIYRCEFCKCLHLAEKKPEEVKPRRREETQGTSGYRHVKIRHIEAETYKALLIAFNDPQQSENWVPKSVIADPEDYHEGTMYCEISIKEWFMQKLEGVR